jgi:hypothetical protein
MATAAVIVDAIIDPLNAAHRQATTRRPSSIVRAMTIKRTIRAAAMPPAVTPTMFNSSSPPNEEHQAHDQHDDIAEIRVQAAGLQHLHGFGQTEYSME